MASYRIAQVNRYTLAQKVDALRILVAIMLCDAILNEASEVIKTEELWHAAQADGFTSETFTETFSQYWTSKEIQYDTETGCIWVPAIGKTWELAQQLKQEYYDWQIANAMKSPL